MHPLIRCLALIAMLLALPPRAAGQEDGARPGTGEPMVYRTPPPAGKLPWPQHAPDWNAARYRAMLDSLFIVTNFGVYQGSADGAQAYLHSGLDVMLPNGTPVYAVQSGTVVAEIGGSEFYRTLVIEDEGRPGHGWSYTHINGFRVRPGQRVRQGTLLATVHFRGLEHVHLSRVRLADGGDWTRFQDAGAVYPDSFFVYPDGEAPVFEGRFRFARNGTGAFIPLPADGSTTVSGEVDLVVGLRDGGESAHSPGSFVGPGGEPYGDRNAPVRVEYAIRGNGVEVNETGVDFSRIVISGTPAQGRPQAMVVFHAYESVQPPGPPVGNNSRRFNFYVLTHHAGSGRAGGLDTALSANAWKTDERNAAGQPRFPNGEYVITVRAYDHAGNVSERSETVRVQN